MAFKKPNFKKIEKRIVNSRIKKLEQLSSEIILGIINRTQKGKNISLQSFKRYTREYAKAKAKAHGSSKPNLTREQSMLNSITSKRLKNGIRIGFGSVSEAKKAQGNQKKRKFFGLDKKQRAWIKKKLSKL